MTYQIGQTVFVAARNGKRIQTTIISVGRKWAKLANGRWIEIASEQTNDGWRVYAGAAEYGDDDGNA